MSHPHQAQIEKPDIREKGAEKDGAPQFADKRLYCQLQVFTGCEDSQPLIQQLKDSGLDSVLYYDVNDPKGVAVLILAENPDIFTTRARELYLSSPFSALTHRPGLTMMGRSYSTGREPDLEDWLMEKPKRYAFDKECPWVIWYPLRRKPDFELLEPREQGKVLMEHGMIGRSYGESGYAYDIRLACHGLDQNDNEFLLGLVGKELYPLSRLIQEMRKTQQTSKYIQSLGPFFIGKAAWRSKE